MTDDVVSLPIKRLDPTVELPSYAYAGDAGLDLRANEDVTLQPLERRLVSTGLAVAIPEGYAGFVQPRSGLALREGLSMANTPGLVDSHYRGELKVCAVNLDAERPIHIERGERIPLHGVKVGLGTMVSLYLYKTLRRRPAFEGCERVYAEADKLPSSEYVEGILSSLGCPTRFSSLGVSAETVRTMFFEAYKIRDRFTVLTLYCTKGWMKEAADELMERFF